MVQGDEGTQRYGDWKNEEGYADPTAGAAVSAMMREYRRKRRLMFREKNRRRIFVSSPWSGATEQNAKAARRYCRRIVEEGHVPFAPHLFFPQFLDDKDPEERELGLLFALGFLKLCDELWAFGEPTPGMRRELEEADRLHMPIRLFGADGKDAVRDR